MNKDIKLFFNKEFILRTPILSYHEIYDLKEEELLNLFKQPIISNSIYLASPELYDEIIRKVESKENLSKSLLISLNKYLTRMGCRSTPFGLFSGVSIGSIANDSSVVLSKMEDYISFNRLDMDYLCELSEYLEKDEFIKNNIKFYVNTSLYKLGNEIRYVESKFNNKNRKFYLTSIDSTDYINEILNYSIKGKTIKELSDFLINKKNSESEAVSFIEELIENKILISSVSPTVTGEDYFNILKRNTKGSKYDEWFMEMSNLLKKLNKSNISLDQIDFYKYINQLSNEYVKKRYFLQTDLLIKTEKNNLSVNILNQLKDSLRVLNKLTSKSKNNELEKFKLKFNDRFGEQLIPLTLALDVESGIGYGDSNIYNNISNLTENLIINNNTLDNDVLEINEIDNLLLRLLLKNKDSNIINIKDSDLKHLEENWRDIPKTFSVLFQLFNETSLNIVGVGGNNTSSFLLGRFTHIDEINEIVNGITKIEDEIDKISAEITHLPENRTGNILFRRHIRKFEIPYLSRSNIQEEYQININDLFIKIEGDQIILYSKKHNKEVVPYLSNAHNFWTNSLPIYYFLCDLGSQNKRNNLSFSWNDLFIKNFEYLPRLVYKNVIISLAQWRLNKSEIKLLLLSNDFSYLEIKRNIPKLFLLVEGDNQLLFNLNNKLSFETFLKEIKNKNQVLIKEFLFEQELPIVLRDNKPFVNEFICTFHIDS